LVGDGSAAAVVVVDGVRICIVGLPRGIPTGMVCLPIHLEDTLFDFEVADTINMTISLSGQAPPPWRFVGQRPGHGGCGSSVHRALVRAGGGCSTAQANHRSVVVHPSY